MLQGGFLQMATVVRPKIRREELRPGEVLCDYCTAKCCRYFALVIETPTTRQDFDFIRWYLLHERATIFTEDDRWYLLMHTQCAQLRPDNRCGIYEDRPTICREYSTDHCEYEDNYLYDRYFETPEQIAEYSEAVLARGKGGSLRSARPPLLPVIS
jgi:Fe-S-cluster containining protein